MPKITSTNAEMTLSLTSAVYADCIPLLLPGSTSHWHPNHRHIYLCCAAAA
jgi:hypothetical protein